MLVFIIIVTFILIAVGLAWYLLSHDRGEREPIGALWIAAGFGFGGAIVAAVLESLLVPAHDIKLGTPLWPLLAASLVIGAIEELCKFVPLALFLFSKRYFNEHTDGVIYFALAGLGFGLPENILYTLQFGAKAGLGRVVLTPLFHAAITGLVGFFLAKAKLAGLQRRTIWPILLLAAILHGFYDFGLASGSTAFALLSVAITFGLTICFFLVFWQATELDQIRGLAASGKNNYCRHCGYPNPDHHLYCTHCGKRA